MNKLDKYPCIFFIGAVLIIGLFPSCSVKEDRDNCPAVLSVELPPSYDEASGVFITLTGPDGTRETHLSPLEKDTSSVSSFPVTRERFLLDVATAPPGPEGYIIRQGEQCPFLYLYRAYVTVPGEQALVRPSLHKEFCNMEIKVVPQNLSMKLRVKGSFCGIRADGSLVGGAFSHDIAPGGSLRVPRQGDNSLALEIIVGEEDSVRCFAIGEFLAGLGYDWMSQSLEDVSIEIDYARSKIILRTDFWSGSYPFEVVL